MNSLMQVLAPKVAEEGPLGASWWRGATVLECVASTCRVSFQSSCRSAFITHRPLEVAKVLVRGKSLVLYLSHVVNRHPSTSRCSCAYCYKTIIFTLSLNFLENLEDLSSGLIMPFITQIQLLPSGVTLGYRLAQPINRAFSTIVLFHSFLMDSALYEPQFTDPVFACYNLIAIDEHGHGKTSGRTQFTFWDTAKDSFELLHYLGIDKFFVLGTSQGGFIALRMALLAPERVLGLVLLGTDADAETDKNKTLFLEARQRWCNTPVPTERELEFKTSSFGGKDAVSADVFDAICKNWRTRHAGMEGYGPASQCLCDRDSLLERLEEIRCPVLIMHGTNDAIYKVASARVWASKLKHLYKFVEVEGGWHYLSFTGPGVEACRIEIPSFITYANHAEIDMKE